MIKREYPLQPIVGVGVVVFKADSVLLIRRGKPPRLGEWSLPGGAQELGETVFAAGAREVLEETNIIIGPPKLVDIVDAIRKDEAERIASHYTLIDLTAEWVSGTAKAGTDAMDAQWIALPDVEGLGMWPETHRIIAQARQMW